MGKNERALCFLVVSREELCACLRLNQKSELEPQNFIFCVTSSNDDEKKTGPFEALFLFKALRSSSVAEFVTYRR